VIPLVLVGIFALSAWLAHDAWTTPPTTATPQRRRRHRVEEFLHRAGLHDVTPREFVLFSAAAGVAVGVLAQLMLGWPLVSLVIALLAASLPYLFYVTREEARRARLQAELAEAIALLRTLVGAGHEVPQALEQLSSYGPDTLQPEFGRVVGLMRGGLSLREALLSMRLRLADPVFDACVATLIWNAALGSRELSPVLDEMVHTVREDCRTQAEIFAQRVRIVWSARVISAVPIFLLVVIRVVSPHYLDLFDTLEGQLLLAGCAISIGVGYAGMLWTARLPTDARVLVA